MKKLLLLLTVVCIMQTKAQTNVYHPFPASAEWLRNIGGSNGCCQYFYGIESGDTVVNTISYKKLYEQSGNWFPNCGTSHPCFTPSTPLSYIGGLRQDSAAKKIYHINSAGTSESLLYDFNLQLGSVVQSTSSGTVTVTKVDSMLISGSYHKRFFFYDTTYNSNQSYWVEGVGSSGGLLTGIFNMFEGQYQLNCFNNNSISPPDNGASCSIPLANVHLFAAYNYLKIYPNPAQNNFTIETTSTDKQNLFVYDINGKQVLTQIIQGNTNIDVSSLAAGVYNVSIANTQSVINKKLIIVR